MSCLGTSSSSSPNTNYGNVGGTGEDFESGSSVYRDNYQNQSPISQISSSGTKGTINNQGFNGGRNSQNQEFPGLSE
jgi:hypothetical protein